jgi:diguanylate cyclase (GGDEF)-like protein/PAS domain S-box-containing protein
MKSDANENYLKKELYELVKSDSSLFDFIQEGSLDGMWYWNLENTEDEWLSPKFWEVFGYDPKEKTHHSREWQSIIFEEDLKEVTDNLVKHLKDPKNPFDQIVRYKHKNGSTVWIRCRGIAIRDNSGKAIRMLGAHTNITDIKLQEKERLESEEKYRLLFETMAQGVVYQNSEGYITSANPSAEKILGLSLSQMQGKTSMDPRWRLIDENGKSISGENHPAMIALRTRKTVGPVVCGVYHPEDDRYVWLNLIAIPLFTKGEDKPNQVYTTFEDITEKRVADSEVAYRKDLLQYVIGHGNQGIAVHDKNLNYVYVSDKYCDMYKVDKNIIGKHHYEVFPDLPQKWRDVHQRTLKGETIKGDRDVFERADGSIEYTRWLSQPWYDQNEEIAGIIIYTEIINELVNTEAELKKTIEQLQRVMDNLTIGIAVNSVNPDVEFEYMNENFPKFYGTTREKLMNSGSFWDEVYEDEDFRAEIKQKVLEGLASNDPKLKRWEFVPITKNGIVERYVTAQGVNVPDSSLIISMVMDVTEQRLKEEAIIYASNHDFLTNLPNRKHFEEKLIELDQDQYYPLLVTMIDFDGLKLINDAYGHNIGDIALQEVSMVLKNSLKETDFLARVGGDEFVILCPNTTSEEFNILYNIIMNSLQQVNVEDMKLSLSIGHDVKKHHAMDINEVLKNAENNMYSSKILHGQSARNETIMTLFETLNEKYEEEKLHSDRVSKYCKQMGEKLNLTIDQIKELEFAGLMHDIGKITIPDKILDKPCSLTDEEWVIMKKHTINGYNILRSADKYSKLAEYALTHHERWDGKGYPNGLRGEEIPLFSRIISIADTFEAMTADRPYRKALDSKVAIAELHRCAGSQFDAKLVEIFVKEIVEI